MKRFFALLLVLLTVATGALAEEKGTLSYYAHNTTMPTVISYYGGYLLDGDLSVNPMDDSGTFYNAPNFLHVNDRYAFVVLWGECTSVQLSEGFGDDVRFNIKQMYSSLDEQGITQAIVSNSYRTEDGTCPFEVGKNYLIRGTLVYLESEDGKTPHIDLGNGFYVEGPFLTSTEGYGSWYLQNEKYPSIVQTDDMDAYVAENPIWQTYLDVEKVQNNSIQIMQSQMFTYNMYLETGFQLVRGKLPKLVGRDFDQTFEYPAAECLVSEAFAERNNLKIGDTFRANSYLLNYEVVPFSAASKLRYIYYCPLYKYESGYGMTDNKYVTDGLQYDTENGLAATTTYTITGIYSYELRTACYLSENTIITAGDWTKTILGFLFGYTVE